MTMGAGRNPRMPRTPWLAEEVIQSSAMDCGPAALKSLAAGFGLRLDYDRLREVCRTQVDGTSIDSLEDVANALGLEAAQEMVPPDGLEAFLRSKRPFIAIVRTPYGGMHFAVVWRRFRRTLQLMDPNVGRRFLPEADFVSSLVVHNQRVPAEAWLSLIRDQPLWEWLRQRLESQGVRDARKLVESSVATDGWRGFAALDAAARMIERMRGAGASFTDRNAGERLTRLYALALQGLREGHDGPESIPKSLYFATFAGREDDGTELITLRGAVLLAVKGVTELAFQAAKNPAKGQKKSAASRLVETEQRRPLKTLWKLVGRKMSFPLVVGTTAAALSAGAAILEAVFFRASFSIVDQLRVPRQSATFLALLAGFFLASLAVEATMAWSRQWAGRYTETRLQLAILEKLPLLPDEFFRSRLVSDLSQRTQSIEAVRTLPRTLLEIVRACTDLTLTTVAIALLDRALVPFAVLAFVLSIGVPILASRAMFERDLRLLSHGGALATLHLDVLRGLAPMRMHNAERAMRVEHEALLVPWYAAARSQERLSLWVSCAELLVSSFVVIGIIMAHARHGFEGQLLLLLFFWVQRIPPLGEAVIANIRAWSSVQAVMLRAEEPLRARERNAGKVTADAPPSDATTIMTTGTDGVGLTLQNASVSAGGQTILHDVTLEIRPGEHVAIVGQSGAGKSSLLSLLLGFLEHEGGRVLVDHTPLTEGLREKLRRHIVWVDPGIHLWNTSVLENIHYGSEPRRRPPMVDIVRQADLLEILERLPAGQRTPLGEGGGMVSGGEAQRIRFARGLARGRAKLVLLDEAFRGLDRDRRRELLGRARTTWSHATMLCVTHDVSETAEFDRVLVIENGELIEDGAPSDLLAKPSRYRALWQADADAHDAIWSGGEWRHIRVARGEVTQQPPRSPKTAVTPDVREGE
jgi:ABC-type bacteriocin/lantibiotic exporter with double-glycine peptidase domain